MLIKLIHSPYLQADFKHIVDAVAGTLPACWADVGSFPALNLLGIQSGTKMSGTLPPEWGSPAAWQQLQYLYLVDCPLTGGALTALCSCAYTKQVCLMLPEFSCWCKQGHQLVFLLNAIPTLIMMKGPLQSVTYNTSVRDCLGQLGLADRVSVTGYSRLVVGKMQRHDMRCSTRKKTQRIVSQGKLMP